MSFDRNEIETRFIAEIDDPSFDEIDRRLKETAENASEAQRAVIAVPSPLDPLAPAGGGGDLRQANQSLSAATQGIRVLSRSASALGVEMGAGADAVLTVATTIPPLILGLNGMTASIVAAEIATGPFLAAAVAIAAVMGIAAVAIDFFKGSSEEAAEAMQEQVAAQEAYNNALNSTSDSIENQIAANEELLETNQRNLENIEALAKTVSENEPSNIFWGLGDAFGWVGAEGDQLNEKLKELRAEEEELKLESEALAKALNSVEVAANDATQALLQESDILASIRKFEQEALASSAEENDKRAQAIVDESAIIRERIKLLEDSKNQTKEVADEIADLNSELGQLGQQSNILNSSAVAAAEAQRALAAAEIELEASAKAAASAAKAAASMTAAARAAESKAMAADSRADKKAAAERTKLGQEQAQEFGELQLDQHEARIKAEKDFNKSIEDLVENQSFLAAIDKQDDFVDTEQERRNAAKKELISLQMSLAEERIVREIAAQEANADREASIAEASANLRNAQREEIRLRRAADREALKLQRNRAEQESDLQAQVNKNTIAMIQSVVTFSANAASQVQRNLSQSATGGKKGRKGKSITSSLAEMMNEVMR